ncbi:protein FAM220A-like isoform X1 [Pteronotus mesoamericanus]|uniref:protein FAM220A-like isoform X1 n=1 Tax=Pteronotus mesoamericanus TaxID=1884717 RepID=UPI0023EC5F49|nr:protein FAM220A-like isoform X1 [Pteronotus parnellii mesoamericanus]
MRDGRGTLGSCLSGARGEDLDKLRCGLWTQESPRPSGAPSWARKPAADLHGNPHNETPSVATKGDLSKASLLRHNGIKVLLYLKGSVRRNCASTVAQSKTVDLFSAPAEECVGRGSCGVEEALVRDWLGGGPRATGGHRGRCRGGGPAGSGLPCHQKRSETEISEGEPRAFLEMRGLEPDLCLPHPVSSPPLHAHPHVSSNDAETECASPGRSEPALSGRTGEHGKMLPSMRSTSNDLQTALGLLAVRAFQVAKPLRHN